MKNLYLIRGVSGAGKTTFAESICGCVISADQYFERDGEYNFDASQLGRAHKWCFDETERSLVLGYSVAVANTFTTVKELKPYLTLGETYDYTIFSIIVENRHGNKDIHNVPEETLEKQRNRFNMKL